MKTITTQIVASGVPVKWVDEINAVSDNFSRAVRVLLREALDARAKKKARAK